jgi:ubiquinone/menaquinone biosynthesis C-methylase UbiE
LTKSLAQQRFGKAAADYATSEVHAKGESLKRLVELAEPKSHWRVLDVATGAGHTALAFAPHVAKVTATDITEEMLREARKLAASRGLANVRTLLAKAEDLPFPDASFDLVVCRLAAHHFDDMKGFAAEAYRMLMPGGMIGIVDTIAPDASIVPGQTAEDLRNLPLTSRPSRHCRTQATGAALASSNGSRCWPARDSMSRTGSTSTRRWTSVLGSSACARTRTRQRG